MRARAELLARVCWLCRCSLEQPRDLTYLQSSVGCQATQSQSSACCTWTGFWPHGAVSHGGCISLVPGPAHCTSKSP
jgi:hypothetical protein